MLPYAQELEDEAISRALQLDHKIAHYRVHKKSDIDDALEERNESLIALYALILDINNFGRRAFSNDPRIQNYSTIK